MTISKTDIVARLRQTHRIQCECVGCESANEIERLRAERDEARQLCCRMSAQFIYLSNQLCTAKFVANEKGWDCFKEEPRWNSDPNIISLDELARCTRNQTP